jgi:hypothetical protein
LFFTIVRFPEVNFQGGSPREHAKRTKVFKKVSKRARKGRVWERKGSEICIGKLLSPPGLKD